MSAATLIIDRWDNEIHVPYRHPAPWRVRDAVEHHTQALETHLAEALDAYLSRRDGEVILIRDLSLELDLDLSASAHIAGRAIARRFAAELVETIETRPEAVLRFASHAAYIARYIEEVAAGRAGTQWFFRRFEGLTVLPAGVAIRTALLDRVEETSKILSLIGATSWLSVLVALGTDECERVLEALGLDATPTAPTIDVGALLTAAESLGTSACLAPPLVALRLWGLLAQAQTILRPGDGAALAVAALVMHAGATHNNDLSAALFHRESVVYRGFTGRMIALLKSPGALGLRQLTRALLELQRTVAREARATIPDSYSSPAAGLAILLDELEELFGDLAPVQSASRTDGVHAGSLALAILALAAGPMRFEATWHDPVWRQLLAVDSHLKWPEFIAGLADECLADLALRWGLLGERDFSAPLRLRVRAASECIEVDVDPTSGLWTGRFHGPSSARAARARTARARADERVPRDVDRKSFRSRLQASRRARADWLDLTPHCDSESRQAGLMVLVCAAQRLWRRLAQRVPGMSGASLSYLRSTLLPPEGVWERMEPDQWSVRLSRPPLYVLLCMTTASRGRRLPGALMAAVIEQRFV